mgnify:CR=1 FL=1
MTKATSLLHYSIFSVHSFSLNPGNTKPSATTSGLFTNMPFVARSCSCSSSPMSGSLSFSFISLYSMPLVLKNFLRGSSLRVYQLLSSSYVGFSSFIWVQANFAPTETLSHFISSSYKLNISLQIFFPHSVLKILSYACCAASLDRLSSIIFTRKSASTSI